MADLPLGDPPPDYVSYDPQQIVQQQQPTPEGECPPDDFYTFIDGLDIVDALPDVYNDSYTTFSSGELTSTLRSCNPTLSTYSDLSEITSALSGESVGPLTPSPSYDDNQPDPVNTNNAVGCGAYACGGDHESQLLIGQLDPCMFFPPSFSIPTQYGYGQPQQLHPVRVAVADDHGLHSRPSDGLPITAPSPSSLINDSYVSAGARGDGPHTSLSSTGGAIDPSLLLVQGIPRPLEGLVNDQEQPRLQHPADAATDAPGLGITVQVDCYLPQRSSNPDDPTELYALHDNPAGSMDDTLANVRKHSLDDAAEPPAKRRRPQSTEKRFPCLHPGCNEMSARKNNINKHISSIHNCERPYRCEFLDCPKFAKGYSRRSDLNTHRTKIHGCEPKGSKRRVFTNMVGDIFWCRKRCTATVVQILILDV